MKSRASQRWLCLCLVLAGCSQSAAVFEAPDVDPVAAAEQAIELYDSNGDKSLSKEELAKCPGVLSRLSGYDVNGDGAVSQEEFTAHLQEFYKRGTGGTMLSAQIIYKGRPLSGATVILEPEPYLGGEVQTAQAVTTGAGLADLAIPPEFVPEHLRRMKTVHCGTFKVRVTHPTIKIPAKYNTDTVLGYETEVGNPNVTFKLTDK